MLTLYCTIGRVSHRLSEQYNKNIIVIGKKYHNNIRIHSAQQKYSKIHCTIIGLLWSFYSLLIVYWKYFKEEEYAKQYFILF